MEELEIVDGLIGLGCDFLLGDVKRQFPVKKDAEKITMFEGMKKGYLSCGASIIANFIERKYAKEPVDEVAAKFSSGFVKAYCYDRFLSIDDETSIYNFIRIATGDESYTKEYVDSLQQETEKHR